MQVCRAFTEPKETDKQPLAMLRREMDKQVFRKLIMIDHKKTPTHWEKSSRKEYSISKAKKRELFRLDLKETATFGKDT